MPKRNSGRKFARPTDQRKAFKKALVTAFILKEKIKTTEARAKEIRGLVDKFINLAKEETLASQRRLIKFLDKRIVERLIKEIKPKCQGRTSGYTRIVKLGRRMSDGAKMAIIELVK
mgnify:CR=1 FL=1